MCHESISQSQGAERKQAIMRMYSQDNFRVYLRFSGMPAHSSNRNVGFNAVTFAYVYALLAF